MDNGLVETMVGLMVISIIAIAVVIPTITTMIANTVSVTAVTESEQPDYYNYAINLANRDLELDSDTFTNTTNTTGTQTFVPVTDYVFQLGDSVTLGSYKWLKNSTDVGTTNSTEPAAAAEGLTLVSRQSHANRYSATYNTTVYYNDNHRLNVSITNTSDSVAGNVGLYVGSSACKITTLPIPLTTASYLFTNVSGSCFTAGGALTQIYMLNETGSIAWIQNTSILTTNGAPFVTASYSYYPYGYQQGTIGNLLTLIPLLLALVVLLGFVALIK